MDQNRDTGSEDNRQAAEHVHNAQENRDALQDQARRVQATAPHTSQPVQGLQADGMGGEDTTRAEENVRRAHENAAALRDEASRVAATTPPDVNRTGPAGS